MGSCLTLRNEFSKETHTLTMQKILLESGRVREPGELLCPGACRRGFYGSGGSFQLSLANRSASVSFLAAGALFILLMDSSEKDAGRLMTSVCCL